MNIARENLDDLNLVIKIDIAEEDYAEKVTKQLKEYQKRAVIKGFRPGKAPMGMIQKMYKTAVTADEVQLLLSESLYKYLIDEKLDIVGSPLSNTDRTGEVDFEKDKAYTFYFDVALQPAVNLAWDKVDAKLYQVKVNPKDIDKQVEMMAQRYGKFETPDEVGEGDYVYGKVVELTKEGEPKEGGVNTFVSFSLSTLKNSEEVRSAFIGKKVEEKVKFNAAKAFTPADIETHFHLDAAAAKKFKSDVELTLSGCSRIIPQEVDDELFKMVFPGEEIKDVAAFRKRVSKDLEKSYNEQGELLYINTVRKTLIDECDTTLPEAFLRRWILSREDNNITPEKLDEEWQSSYIPSFRWEFIESELNKIKPVEPTRIEIIDYIKDILRKGDVAKEGEDEQAREQRLEQEATTIAQDKNNTQNVIDRIYANKTFELFKEKLNPEIEKVTIKEFTDIAKKASE